MISREDFWGRKRVFWLILKYSYSTIKGFVFKLDFFYFKCEIRSLFMAHELVETKVLHIYQIYFLFWLLSDRHVSRQTVCVKCGPQGLRRGQWEGNRSCCSHRCNYRRYDVRTSKGVHCRPPLLLVYSTQALQDHSLCWKSLQPSVRLAACGRLWFVLYSPFSFTARRMFQN